MSTSRMGIESAKRDPERLYPEHYDFGISEPVPEEFERPVPPEGFVPVTITVIRHHLTDYKELVDPSFTFDQTTPELNAHTLDLKEEGIDGMRATAEDLAKRIDPDTEIVYVVTSPQFRAQSSLLVLADELRKHGIETFNDPASLGENLILPSLRQNALKKTENSEELTQEWMQKASELTSENPEERKRSLPHLAHAEVAKALGLEIGEVMEQTHTKALERFMRTLRHVANIGDYLTQETKSQLEAEKKKLRVIMITHEELPSGFMQHALDTKENLKNGQVLEIEAEGPMRNGEETVFDTRLYPLQATETFVPPVPSEFNDIRERRVPITFKK
jgi:broad specificity phosphatase PhoE